MGASTMTEATVLDIRAVKPPRTRELVSETFRALPAGEAFELVHDRNPGQLYQHLVEQAQDVDWDFREYGPSVWRVRVARRP